MNTDAMAWDYIEERDSILIRRGNHTVGTSFDKSLRKFTPEAEINAFQKLKLLREAGLIDESRELKNIIAINNLGLAYKCVSMMRNIRKINEDDFLSEALYILARCIDLFNPDYKIKFSTYAMRSIFRKLSGKMTNTPPEEQIASKAIDEIQDLIGYNDNTSIRKMVNDDTRAFLDALVQALSVDERAILLEHYGVTERVDCDRKERSSRRKRAHDAIIKLQIHVFRKKIIGNY